MSKQDGRFLRICLRIILIAVGFLLLACCNRVNQESPAPTFIIPTTAPEPSIERPTTNAVLTAESGTSPAVETSIAPLDITQQGEEFLAIDEILNEIDNDVCQSAYATQLELAALIAEGVDVIELETAVQELIEELGNCPTPTPKP